MESSKSLSQEDFNVDWQTKAPFLVYHSYPERDVLMIDPPEEGETINQFKERAENAGDTLFLHLCREAGDDCEDGEIFLARINRSIEDLVLFKRALEKRLRKTR